MIEIFIIVREWPAENRKEIHSAYLSEQNAIYAAQQLAGKEGALVSVQKIEVEG